MLEYNLIDHLSNFAQHPNKQIYQAAQELVQVYENYDAQFGDQIYIEASEESKTKDQDDGMFMI